MPGSSTNDGSGKQPQIRFNITRATGSIPETSTLQDQTNSVESAGSDSPNAAPSTTTNQSPQQQAPGTTVITSPQNTKKPAESAEPAKPTSPYIYDHKKVQEAFKEAKKVAEKIGALRNGPEWSPNMTPELLLEKIGKSNDNSSKTYYVGDPQIPDGCYDDDLNREIWDGKSLRHDSEKYGCGEFQTSWELFAKYYLENIGNEKRRTSIVQQLLACCSADNKLVFTVFEWGGKSSSDGKVKLTEEGMISGIECLLQGFTIEWMKECLRRHECSVRIICHSFSRFRYGCVMLEKPEKQIVIYPDDVCDDEHIDQLFLIDNPSWKGGIIRYKYLYRYIIFKYDDSGNTDDILTEWGNTLAYFLRLLDQDQIITWENLIKGEIKEDITINGKEYSKGTKYKDILKDSKEIYSDYKKSLLDKMTESLEAINTGQQINSLEKLVSEYSELCECPIVKDMDNQYQAKFLLNFKEKLKNEELENKELYYLFNDFERTCRGICLPKKLQSALKKIWDKKISLLQEEGKISPADVPQNVSVKNISDAKEKLVEIKSIKDKEKRKEELLKILGGERVNRSYYDAKLYSLKGYTSSNSAIETFEEVWNIEGKDIKNSSINAAIMCVIAAMTGKNNLVCPYKQEIYDDNDQKVRNAYEDLFEEICDPIEQTTEGKSKGTVCTKIDQLLWRRLKKFGNKTRSMDCDKDLKKLQKKAAREDIKYISDKINLTDEEQTDIDSSNAKKIIQGIFKDSEIELQYRPLAALCKILKDNKNESTAKTIITQYYIHKLHKFARNNEGIKPMCEVIENIIFNRWGCERERKRDKFKKFFKREKT